MSFTNSQGVGVVYGNGTVALENIELRARPENGSPWSGLRGARLPLLLRLLAASLKPSSGKLSLLGTAPWAVAPQELRKLRARIGMVHQSAAIARASESSPRCWRRLGRWPVEGAGVVAVSARPGRRATRTGRLDLGGRLFERCDRLSGGQLQRVALARVLYQQPDLILPTNWFPRSIRRSPISPPACSTRRRSSAGHPGGEPACDRSCGEIFSTRGGCAGGAHCLRLRGGCGERRHACRPLRDRPRGDGNGESNPRAGRCKIVPCR